MSNRTAYARRRSRIQWQQQRVQRQQQQRAPAEPASWWEDSHHAQATRKLHVAQQTARRDIRQAGT